MGLRGDSRSVLFGFRNLGDFGIIFADGLRKKLSLFVENQKVGGLYR